jgi:hypothetical protein
MTAYHIIAYPNGRRAVVGTHHARYVECAVEAAYAHAVVRGEYVDDEEVAEDGRAIATVGPEGPIPA